jgi:hypothetical protein
MILDTKIARVIPADILRAARDVLSRQSVIPDSPGTRSDTGETLLCAAAAIASAGAARSSNEFATRLMERALATGDKEPMTRSFEALGWPPALCTAILIKNDSIEVAQRRAVMVQLIEAAIEDRLDDRQSR